MKAALYARFSTARQSEASIGDQLRVCADLAGRHGFTVVAEFTDAAVSGGTANRPGYQALLESARRGDYDVIVAEDTSRLWRNLAEQAPRLAELADLGIDVVTHDLDTRTESAGMLGAVLGASSESYRREIGRRTRRGLEGRAREKKSTGGRAYGYVTVDGERRIHPERAAIVREIFERFAAGDSLLAIAADLNVRGIPSPAADWDRKRNAADGKWRKSAIHAMLRNELYSGRLIWNRSKWVRSAADSRKRRRVENPPDEWIVHDVPELRIVDADVWRRVQDRHAAQDAMRRKGKGGSMRHLLSGLLRCGICGGAYVISAHRPVRYGCSTNRNAGDSVCSNRALVRKDLVETLVLDRVRDDLLSPAAVDHALRTMRKLARAEASGPSADIARLDQQIAELRRLQESGAVSADLIEPALQRAYSERERMSRPARKVEPVFGAERAYRATVDSMRDALAGDDAPAAREALHSLVGTIRIRPQAGKLFAELSAGSAIAVAVNQESSGGAILFELTPAALSSTRNGVQDQ